MLYAVPPSNSAGPAVLLAALVGFLSTFRLGADREVLLKTGHGCGLNFCCGFFLRRTRRTVCWTNRTGTSGALPLNVFLVPLLVLAALQYAMSTIATAWFLSFDAGKFTLFPTRRNDCLDAYY